MDKQKLNAIYNSLKDLVGEQGAFLLFAAGQNGQGAGEDMQIRAYGPLSRQIGLLSIGGEMVNAHVEQKLERNIERTSEPD